MTYIDLGARSERSDLGRVKKGTAHPGKAEEGIEQEEDACCGKLASPRASGEEYKNGNERSRHADRSAHERFPAAKALNEKDGEDGTNGVFGATVSSD